VIQAVNGKGTLEIVRKLEQIKDLLSRNCFDIVGYAFDGNSCYNRSHRQFQESWRCQSRQFQDPRGLIDMPVPSLLVYSNILHVLKRIRYRLVPFDANAEGDDQDFFTQLCACSCSTSIGCLPKHESHKDAGFSSITSVLSADNTLHLEATYSWFEFALFNNNDPSNLPDADVPQQNWFKSTGASVWPWRVRCRDVKIIQKFVTALGSGFLNMKSNVILDLVSIPKHPTVLGANCETYV
jgi:hypothetical protein